MAANYWASTQRRHWLFTRENLAEVRDKQREKDMVAHTQFPLPDQRMLNIYFSQREFGKMISGFGLKLMLDRTHKAWEEDVNPTASPSHRPDLHQTILYEE